LKSSEISNFIGKDLSERILSSLKKEGEFSGQDLKIGGEWAENLYDRQIPNILKKLTGRDVEMFDLQTKGVVQKFEGWKKSVLTKQPTIRLTPELKKEILSGKGKVNELFSLAPLALAGSLAFGGQAQAGEEKKKKTGALK